MDDRESEELKRQIDQTRCNLVDKLETLEERVVEPVTAAMTESVTKVKEAVDNTLQVMQGTMTKVTETFDLATHVRNYPWRMVGAGLATGFVLGNFFKSRPSTPTASRNSSTAFPSNTETFRNNGRHHSQDEARGSQEAASSQQRSDSQTSSEGWSKLATEIQGALILSLAPMIQGLLGAVFAEIFRRPQSAGEEAPSAARHPLDEDRVWTAGEVMTDPDWGGRLRSRPK